MKLFEIEVENFGVLDSRRLTFADQPVQILYGPNEAGKSTLLQLVRELLFGFAVRNPLAFESHTGEMAATAVAHLRDGRRVRFRRRKGNKDRVLGEFLDSGEPVDEAELHRLLGGGHAELFQHVFGISLAELQQGRDSLAKANLSEAIYGSGLGRLNGFQQVRARLQQEQEELYKKRGRTPLISRLLREVQQYESQLEQNVVSPQQYAELLERVDEAQREVDRSSERVRDLRSRVTHRERLVRALPNWHQLKRLGEQLQESNLPAPLDSPLWLELQQRWDSRTRLRDRSDEGRRALRELQSECDEQSIDPDVLEHATAIAGLNQHVGRIQSLARDIPLRQSEANAILREVEAGLRQLDPTWTIETLDRYQLGVAQETRIQQLIGKRRELDKTRERLGEQLREAEQSVNDLRLCLEEVSDDGPLPNESLLRRAQRVLEEAERGKRLAAEAQSLTRQADQRLARLASTVKLSWDESRRDDVAERVSRPIPLPATVAEYESAWEDQHQRIASAEAERRRFEQLRDELAAEIRSLEQWEVPSREELQLLREQRDALLERLSAGGEGLPVTGADVEQLRVAVEAADRCADQRQLQAERVAQHDQLLVRQQQARTDLASAETRLERCRDDFERLRGEWRAVWSANGFAPQTPKTMAQWCELRDTWLELVDRRVQVSRELDEMATERRDVVTRLREVMGADAGGAGEVSDASLTRWVAAYRERLEDVRDRAAARKHAESKLPALEARHADLIRQKNACAVELEQWQQAWLETLDSLGLPAEWDVDLGPKLLKGLSDGSARRAKAQDLLQRVEDMRADLADYAQQVSTVSGPLKMEWDGEGDPTELVRRMHRRLLDSQEAARASAVLRKQVKQAQANLEDCRSELDEVETWLDRQREAWQLSSVEQLGPLLQSMARRSELERKRQDTLQNLELCLAPASLEAMRTELNEADGAQLSVELDEFRMQLEAAEREHDAAVRQQAILQTEVEEVRQEDQVRLAADKLESTRAELAAAVERWAPLRIAQSLLQQARETFERQRQPELLQAVETIFRRMTEDRYVRIQRKLDEEGTLLVEQCDGQLKEPGQLSMGTREQLYLAIRLAYIRHYCRDAEPLPVFMDDVLVNFDASRALQTLQVLHELDPDIQVVLLTCHRHTVQRIHEHFPDTPITCLGGASDEQELKEWLQSPDRTRTRTRRKDPAATESNDQRILFS